MPKIPPFRSVQLHSIVQAVGKKKLEYPIALPPNGRLADQTSEGKLGNLKSGRRSDVRWLARKHKSGRRCVALYCAERPSAGDPSSLGMYDGLLAIGPSCAPCNFQPASCGVCTNLGRDTLSIEYLYTERIRWKRKEKETEKEEKVGCESSSLCLRREVSTSHLGG
ncbi:hypothetical protein BDY19DRAFT_1045903 [Irpex rosettiformis]|uniref:Uncharacterized protein n=1 Tax=Irpex rosettiformis TaxID=378272 RepID=A0ACB8UEY1_9APHY|nr:hypothetical protein BDY19DRAFT_1045903 [Irpex rosettiformis]